MEHHALMQNPRIKKSGFTLVELLIVLAIISLLAALVVPALTKGPTKARIVETSSLIQRLKAAIDKYQSDYGDYPPTSLSDFSVTTNKTNDGIEALLACLSTKEKDGPYIEPEEKFLANIDNDKIPASYNLTWYFGDREAREIVDSWGNPLVYFHHRDYEKPNLNLQCYKLANKKFVKGIRPEKSKKTNTFPSWNSYVIWSFGPNGINDYGKGDDITSWK
ncbi:MAG: prepilin-type N-terminal cleavage/methylation domain-containing protein [Planctomycetota bacterium]